MAKNALEGMRVLLMGSVWAGPMCAALFSDMGAEVIRIESHARLDAYRMLYRRDRESLDTGAFFQTINRNLLSVTLNMKQPRGRELAKALIGISDVLLENMSPPVLKKWGLDYQSTSKINPRIIMASISGFGQDGPLKNEAGYGPTTSSLSGLGSMLGYEGEPPLGLLPAYPDPVAGIHAFLAVMAALHYRAKTGKGQYIDISQLEALTAMLGIEALDYTMNGRISSCRGNSSYWMAPHGCYRCKGEDRWITIACATQEEWEAFCRATGNLDWLDEERFADNYCRLNNRKELDELIEEWTKKQQDYEVMETLQQAGVAAVPVFSMSDLFTDLHAQEERYLVHMPHPFEPACYVHSTPWKLDKSPGEILRPAPLMGEHNKYVLCDLCGLSQEEFESLVEEQVIW